MERETQSKPRDQYDRILGAESELLGEELSTELWNAQSYLTETSSCRQTRGGVPQGQRKFDGSGWHWHWHYTGTGTGTGLALAAVQTPFSSPPYAMIFSFPSIRLASGLEKTDDAKIKHGCNSRLTLREALFDVHLLMQIVA